MRTAFLTTITELMRKHGDIVLITADMGYSIFENLQQEFPDRFFNTGVTEQSSMSIAAGFALSGYTVYFYAQAPFATMRCFEQIRLDIAYGNADVKIVGSASGFSSNQLGVSHFAVEDVGLMRMLPNMTVFTPGDQFESEWATQESYKKKGPCYIRITKAGTPVVHKKMPSIELGQAIKIKEGIDLSIFVSGSLLPEAVKAAEVLEESGLKVSLVSCPTVKPIDKDMIRHEAQKTGVLVTIEDHSIIGGLGSSVSDVITEDGLQTKLIKIAVPDKFTDVTGSINYLLDYNGLSVSKIVDHIIEKVKSK